MKLENKMLRLSVYGAVFFALFGVTWGWAIDSEMILFDGMYSFVSLLLSLISLWLSTYINKKDSEGKFPFGKDILEPMVVAFKSLVIAIICIISLKGAIGEVISGGNQVEYGVALIYAVISTVGSATVYLNLKVKGKSLSSELLNAESTQWLMDTLLSVAVLVGFITATILSKTSLNGITKYIDPVMVIISSMVFLRLPITTFIRSFKEILSIKADDTINDDISILVKEIEKEYKFEDSITRVSKVGRALRIEIDFIYNDKTNLHDLDEMDCLREKLSKEMNHLKYNKWLNVSFTGDRKWAL